MGEHSIGNNLSPGGGNLPKVLAVSALLVAMVACVFVQTVGYEFVNLDDSVDIYGNPSITQGVTRDALHWAFTSPLNGNWVPLRWISHMVDWQLFGENAGGHHVVNVILHALNSVLLFLVLRKMTTDFWSCAFAAALWAIHPLRVESVAWVTERKDVLSGFFFMLTLWTYASYVRQQLCTTRSILWFLAVVAFFVLGLLSKPMLVTLPCVMLLLDYWPLNRIGSPWSLSGVLWRVVEKIPLFALVAGSCVLALWAERTGEYPAHGAWWRFGTVVLSYIAYLRDFFWPANLSLLHPVPGPDLPVGAVWGAAVLLLVITILGVVLVRKRPYLLVGWLWYLGMMLPVIGLYSFGDESSADRFTYLPQIGLCLAIAWSANDWCRSLPIRRWACGIAGVSVLAVLIGCAWHQTTYWRNSETLWNRSIACNSQNYNAHTMLGIALVTKGDTNEAISHFRMAITTIESQNRELVPPSYYQANLNLGIAEAALGHDEEAIACYQKAIAKENPYYAEAQNNLGYGLLLRGDSYGGLTHIDEALRIRSAFAEAHYNRGLALHALKHFDGAMAEYRKAIRLRPTYAEAHYNLGLVLNGFGRRKEAVAEFREALAIKPDFAEARHALDYLSNESGRQ
jgi:protein O-mannosyl-transferase